MSHTITKEWLSPENWRQFAATQTNAHRIYSHGTVAWIERYSEDVLISQTPDQRLEPLLDELRTWSKVIGFVPRRIFHQSLEKQGKSKPQLVQGDEKLPPLVKVCEHRALYSIELGTGASSGLFLDQRANRLHLAKFKPRHLLNCFAYTCSFSVVAALQGAVTTSVDLSRHALQRGEENFRLNGMEPKTHFFNAADVGASLRLFRKKHITFDAIILDPPTFSRSKEGIFRVERDFFDLLDLALQCTAPGSHLLLSTNSSSFTLPALMDGAKRTLAHQHLQGVFWQAPPLVDIPACSMPTATWLTLKI